MSFGIHDTSIDQDDGVLVAHLRNVDEDLLHPHLQLHEGLVETDRLLQGHDIWVHSDTTFLEDLGGIRNLQDSETHLI